MPIVLFLFILLPIAEMWVLIEVGDELGALTTISLVFLTAIIGLYLLRQQGMSTLTRFNRRLEEGQLPAVEMFEGMFLAIGGICLLVPGFVTDVFGFACLLPPLRRAIIKLCLARGILLQAGAQRDFRAAARQQQQHNIIDGEYRRDEDWDR